MAPDSLTHEGVEMATDAQDFVSKEYCELQHKLYHEGVYVTREFCETQHKFANEKFDGLTEAVKEIGGKMDTIGLQLATWSRVAKIGVVILGLISGLLGAARVVTELHEYHDSKVASAMKLQQGIQDDHHKDPKQAP